MTDPAPKVVDLSGNPVEVETQTSPEIMEVIERLRSVAAGEKHVAVGCFLIDAMGRFWLNWKVEGQAHLDSVGAAKLLEERMVRQCWAARGVD